MTRASLGFLRKYSLNASIVLRCCRLEHKSHDAMIDWELRFFVLLLQVMAGGDTSRTLIPGERQVDASVWDHDCARFGLSPSDRLRKVTMGGKTFILTSIDVKKVKYPIIAVDVDGMCYKLPAHQIFALLRTQSADRASTASSSSSSAAAAAAAAAAANAKPEVKPEVKAEVKAEIKAEIKAAASAAAAAFPTFSATSSSSSSSSRSEGPPRKKAKYGLTREQRIFAIEMLLEHHNEEVVPECRGNDSKLEAHFKRAFGSSIAEVFAEGEEDYDRGY
jgi:hypothetical protein